MKILSPVSSRENYTDISAKDSFPLISEKIKSIFKDRLPEKKVVYIDTMRTVLVPAEVYAEGSAASYFKVNNIPVEPREQLDASLPVGGTVAIMATPTDIMRALGEYLGEFAVMSPMQYNLVRIPEGIKLKNKRDKKVVAYMSEGMVYVSVFSVTAGISERLLYSEVAPAVSPVDILYYLNMLEPQFGFVKCPVYIKGDGSEEAVKYIRKFYKKAQCG